MVGIELKYHEMNAETPINPDDFLKRFVHLDLILQNQSIKIYTTPDTRQVERATLLAEYREFLEGRNKVKEYELLDHDTTVLDTVRLLRTRAKSSLDAGALLLTCDYNLYRFDWENSHKHSEKPCAVLPNLFWQILRPFVPLNDVDFARSFAATLALPEFRTIDSDRARAASKLASIISRYANLPELTATKWLSNDYVLDYFRNGKSEAELITFLDSLAFEENATLLEELTAQERANSEIAKNLEQERAKRETAEQKIEDLEALQEAELLKTERARQLDGEKIAELERQRAEEAAQAKAATDKAEAERSAREAAEERAREDSEARKRAEQLFDILKRAGLSAITISVCISFFEAMVFFFPPPQIHPYQTNLGFQIAALGIIVSLVLIWFYRKNRKALASSCAALLLFAAAFIPIIGQR